MMLVAALWMLGFALEMGTPTLTMKIRWDQLQWAANSMIPALWLFYSLQFSGSSRWEDRRLRLGLVAASLLFLALVLSNESHSLMWSNLSFDSDSPYLELEKSFGPIYWVFHAYAFALVFLGAYMAFEMLVRSGDLYRWQASAVLLAAFVPVVGVLLGMAKVGPFSKHDLGPVMVAVATWILGWAIFRLRAVDLRRVGRDAVIESMNHGVIVIDAQEEIVYANPVAQALVGREGKKLIGLEVGEVWTEWPEREGEIDRTTEVSKEIVSGEGETLRAYELRLSALLDWRNRLVGQVALLRDITDRKRAERELQRYAAELKQSNTELERFAYIASHDLQEPLRAIAGYTQLLQRRYQGQLDQDADDFIHFAVDGTQRMQGLIDDLLEYSRVGTRGKPFEETDTRQVLNRVLKNLTFVLEESAAEFSFNGMPTLRADPTQLVQLFQNLIGNAIKFRGEDPIEIEIKTERIEEGWHFCVSDNGIGIEEKYQERIFQIFQRLHSREEYPGNGIGLAICKRIVERHGGKMWVESEPGVGSSFHFTLCEKGVVQL
jgi:PAS domain S-box-containing protein